VGAPTPRPAVSQKPNSRAAVQRKISRGPGHLTNTRFAAVQLARKGSPTTAPKPDKLEFEESTDATTGMMIVFDRHGTTIVERTFASGGGQHAEEKAIDYLQYLVNANTLAPGANEPYLLYLQLSKSPCSSTSIPATRNDGNLGCLERLQNLMLNGLQNLTGGTVTFQVQIAATKPYQAKGIVGAKDASRNNYKDFGGGADGSGSFGLLRGQ
jgi:hypothetical protein